MIFMSLISLDYQSQIITTLLKNAIFLNALKIPKCFFVVKRNILERKKIKKALVKRLVMLSLKSDWGKKKYV